LKAYKLYMPRAPPVRRPINENGLAYRQRLRNRNPQEAVEVNENINWFGLPEDLVAVELVAERLAALVLLEWDLVSGALVVSVVVFAVNVVEFVVPVHCVVTRLVCDKFTSYL
jgi:hypothetical protein